MYSLQINGKDVEVESMAVTMDRSGKYVPELDKAYFKDAEYTFMLTDADIDTITDMLGLELQGTITFPREAKNIVMLMQKGKFLYIKEKMFKITRRNIRQRKVWIEEVVAEKLRRKSGDE